MPTLPMFPLGTVLLPGEVLPLQVFEPRYRALVHDCLMASDPEFGIVMIERGSEVGGGDQRSMRGTVARIDQLGQFPDGRIGMRAVGTRRIRVERWLEDDPYPRADVVDWPDDTDDEPLGEEIERCRARATTILGLANELGHDATLDIALAADATVASYQLVAAVPLGPADRQRLLCATGPRHRVRLLADALDDAEAVLRFRLGSPGS